MKSAQYHYVLNSYEECTLFYEHFTTEVRNFNSGEARLTPPTTDEPELIARAQQGDMQAFEALYHRHKMALYRTALAISGDRFLAEEILQEVFLRAYRHLPQMRTDVSPAPWLYRVMVNLTYDITARRRRKQTMLQKLADWLPTPIKSPEKQVETQELQTMVLKAINRLEIKQRTTLVLFYLQDLSLEEIAEIMNVPVGTVKSRLYYARKKLRNTILADEQLLRVLAYEHS